MYQAGSSRDNIVKKVKKKDGSALGKRAVDLLIARKKRDPSWRGEDSKAGGRPPELTDEEKAAIVKLVEAKKAKAIVTINYCKRMIKTIRRVSRWCVSRALHEAGLAWLNRRDKRAIPTEHKADRIAYCAKNRTGGSTLSVNSPNDDRS